MEDRIEPSIAMTGAMPRPPLRPKRRAAVSCRSPARGCRHPQRREDAAVAGVQPSSTTSRRGEHRPSSPPPRRSGHRDTGSGGGDATAPSRSWIIHVAERIDPVKEVAACARRKKRPCCRLPCGRSALPAPRSGGSKAGRRREEALGGRRCDKCGAYGHIGEECRSRKLWEYVAPMCATQVEGQAFFCIPDCPSDVNLKERSTTALVTVMSGFVTARELEVEFKELLGSNAWRWTARKVDENKYTVRFPTAQMISDWGRFRPLGMRIVQAQIAIDPWNASVGAKDDQPEQKKPRMEHQDNFIRNTNVGTSTPGPTKGSSYNGGGSAPAKFMAAAQKAYGKQVVPEAGPCVKESNKETIQVEEVEESDDYDDDLLSEEFGIQIENGPEEQSSSCQMMGLVKCANPMMHKKFSYSREDEVSILSQEALAEGSKEMQMPKNSAEVKEGDIIMLHEQQIIKPTRQSNRLQAQVMEKFQPMEATSKKRSLEGTNLNSMNSFSVLANDELVSVALNLGVSLNSDCFDKIDLMEDLEIARHTLDLKKASCTSSSDVPSSSNDNITDLTINSDNVSDKNTMLLEWINEDSEEESFTLVQSRKKKKKSNSPVMRISDRPIPLRRSQRSTPSVYRDKGGQENPALVPVTKKQ
ncbi:hypothetical protein EJB05_48275, partial [Eragrostis curvula]